MRQFVTPRQGWLVLAGLVAALLAGCGGGGSSSPMNSPPVARAGSAVSGMLGTSLAVDGSASSDADGDAISYAWTLVGTPAGSAAALSNASTPKPSLVPDREGVYTLSLMVSDGKMSSAAATVTVTATPLQAEIRLDQSEPLADRVKLSLTPGIVLPVSWYADLSLLGDGAVADDNSISWDTAGLSNGSHLVLARVRTGATSYQEIRRTVQVENSSIRITTAAPTIYKGRIELFATVSSSYSITGVTVSLDGIAQTTLSSPNAGGSSYRFDIDTSQAASGTHTIELLATDSSGGSRRSSLAVEISNAPVITLSSPTPPDNGFVSGMLQVNGTAVTDKPGGLTTTVSLGNVEFINTRATTFSGSYELAGLAPGFYTLRVVSRDATGQLSEMVRAVFVTTNPALAYAPSFELPAGAANQLLWAGEGDRLLYRAINPVSGVLEVRVRNLVNGSELTLADSVGLFSAFREEPRGWTISDGRVYASAKGSDCMSGNGYCTYQWSADGALLRNLSAESPHGMAGAQGIPVSHDGLVLWQSGRSLLLFDTVAATFVKSPELPVTQNFQSYDFARVNGAVVLAYSAQTSPVSGPTRIDVYRWTVGEPAVSRLSAGDAWDHLQQLDRERIVWRRFVEPQISARPAMLLAQPNDAGTASTLSSNANHFLLRDGLLAWTEGDPDLNWDSSATRAHTLKAVVAGVTNTLSSGQAVKLLAVSDAYVVFTAQGRLYSWKASTGQTTLRSETVPAPEQALIVNGALIFSVDRLIYRLALN